MNDRPYKLISTDDGMKVRISARGSDVFSFPAINRGTAFTAEQRVLLGLEGLLPSGISTLDRQLDRCWTQYRRQPSDLAKWLYLNNLRDRNEVLFYRLLGERLEEMMPIVYTSTVGLAIDWFSHEVRGTRGVYLSVDHPEEVETALRNTGMGADEVDLLVDTDSEGILGLEELRTRDHRTARYSGPPPEPEPNRDGR